MLQDNKCFELAIRYYLEWKIHHSLKDQVALDKQAH
jgi:hypothetical protein